MAANLSIYDTNRIPVGGARIFIGVIGATPTTDVGAFDTDGGVTMRMMRTGGVIRQGFPSLPILHYVSQEDVEVEFSGLEYNPEQMRFAMGAGITSYSATEETYAFGGDPSVTTCAIHVRHEMLSGMTLNGYIWKARGQSDTVEVNLGMNPSTFPYKYQALHSATDWNGTSLNAKAQLMKWVRQLS